VEQISQALLEMDCGIGKKYEKPYHYTSQKRQLVLLRKFGGPDISTRTLNRRRRKMEDAGYIKRIKRHRRLRDGTFAPGSTITMVLAKGFYQIARVLKRAIKVFSYHRMPKMALNMFNTTDYQSFVDRLRLWRDGSVHQRMDAAVFRTA